MPNNFVSPLRVEYIAGQQWRVLEPFEYHLGTPDGLEFVRVEAGFLTDFASIPQVFWSIWPPTGNYGKPAVIHDNLYVSPSVSHELRQAPRRITRREADAIFLEGMTVLEIPYLTRRALWLGVRIGGRAAWNHSRKAEQHEPL